MMRLTGLACLLLLALDAGSEATSAGRRRPDPCPDGRFPLRDAKPLGAVPDILVVRDGTIALEPSCPAVTARVIPTKRATRLRASWTGCAGVRGRVR